jgi:hypothetical protein
MIVSKPLKVISLGWGVQSFTMAAMSAVGDLEPVDFVIHSDTTHEASWTYEFAKIYTSWFEKNSVKVITVKPSKKHQNYFDNYKGVYIPAFTFSDRGRGQLRRQCTGSWKVEPMRRYFQKVRNGKPIELWLGITTDEIKRAKHSDRKYITHRWPLLEKNMSRSDCITWLENHFLDVPNRSSCVFCPYHDKATWRQIMSSPVDRNNAVRYDQAIRKIRPPFDLFVHQSRVPLDQVDFRTPEEKGQLPLNL